jgi:hypothetical protein
MANNLRRDIEYLPADWDWWQERVAIRMEDGGFSEFMAIRLAYQDVDRAVEARQERQGKLFSMPDAGAEVHGGLRRR